MGIRFSPGDCCEVEVPCVECNGSDNLMAEEYQVVMTGWVADASNNCATCSELNSTFIIQSYPALGEPTTCNPTLPGCLAWGLFSLTCGDVAVQIRIHRTNGLQVIVFPCTPPLFPGRAWPFTDIDRVALPDPLDCRSGGDVDGKIVSHPLDSLIWTIGPVVGCDGTAAQATVTAL